MFLAALFKLAENWKQSIRRRQWHPTPVLLPGTSSEIDGETMETVTDFVLGGSKITADGDCSREFKRCMLLVPGSSPGGSREFKGWGRRWRPWKNTYLITDI